jgi:DNA-binding transcriptional ArsR family regulator
MDFYAHCNERAFCRPGLSPRSAIFERLARDGEQTVRGLTDYAGVSPPAVSKHLAVLKLAGLVW